MRSRFALALIPLLWAGTARADGGSPPSPSTLPPSGGSQEIQAQASLTPRQQAEQLYADGWKDVEKAKTDLADGKDKNAEKKFRKALDRMTRATELDSTYHEAWNMVGFTHRKLHEYDAALAAYDRCLRLKPDYAPAREYLGEACVELGRMDDARAQLAALERLNAKDLADQLRARITAAAKGDSTGAHADSSSASKPSGW